jgi:Mitochondrial carrier protein
MHVYSVHSSKMTTPSSLLPHLALVALVLALLADPSSAASTFGPTQPIFAYPSGISTFGIRRTTTSSRRSSGIASTRRSDNADSGLSFLQDNTDITKVQPCSRSIGNTLLRGALLRIASDLSGGTPLEGIKTRVTITTEGPIEATCNIVRQGGIGALWTGTPSRTVEGALIGAVFMLGSVLTKAQLKKMGAPPTAAALAGGLVGGVAQSVVMTPAGLIFTALNSQHKSGKKETAVGVVRRVIAEKGIGGMFAGSRPMCYRQATNWASRSGFTEIARSALGLSQYGLIGELLSGAIGGVGSCWNTPIETIRVFTQRDVGQGKNPKSMQEYWNDIVAEQGYTGLFRGVTPRAVQAIWQTVFLVVVPNLMGI